MLSSCPFQRTGILEQVYYIICVYIYMEYRLLILFVSTLLKLYRIKIQIITIIKKVKHNIRVNYKLYLITCTYLTNWTEWKYDNIYVLND